jgi:argininosuccinate lyase
VVQLAEEKGVLLTDLTTADFQTVSEELGDGVTAVFDFTASLASRRMIGGTAPEALEVQLKTARRALSEE